MNRKIIAANCAISCMLFIADLKATQQDVPDADLRNHHLCYSVQKENSNTDESKYRNYKNLQIEFKRKENKNESNKENSDIRQENFYTEFPAHIQ